MNNSNLTSFPDALPKVRAAIESNILKSGTWGDGTSAVCMMSAIVNGADNHQDCVTAGWPLWLVRLNTQMFDWDLYETSEEDDARRQEFALSVAEAFQKPRDLERAHELFMAGMLVHWKESYLKTMEALSPDHFKKEIETVKKLVEALENPVKGVSRQKTGSRLDQTAVNCESEIYDYLDGDCEDPVQSVAQWNYEVNLIPARNIQARKALVAAIMES